MLKEIEKLNIEDNLISQQKYNKKDGKRISNQVYSESKLAQSLGTNQKKIIELVENEGLIMKDEITELGKSKGLVLKKYMGKEYIAYPDDLNVFKELSK